VNAMNVSIFIAALVFVQNDGAQAERPARPASIVPSAWFPCRTEDGMPLLFAPADQFNESRGESA